MFAKVLLLLLKLDYHLDVLLKVNVAVRVGVVFFEEFVDLVL